MTLDVGSWPRTPTVLLPGPIAPPGSLVLTVVVRTTDNDEHLLNHAILLEHECTSRAAHFAVKDAFERMAGEVADGLTAQGMIADG